VILTKYALCIPFFPLKMILFKFQNLNIRLKNHIFKFSRLLKEYVVMLTSILQMRTPLFIVHFLLDIYIYIYIF